MGTFPVASCLKNAPLGDSVLRSGYLDHPSSVVDAADGTDDGGGAAAEHLHQPSLRGGRGQLGHRRPPLRHLELPPLRSQLENTPTGHT